MVYIDLNGLCIYCILYAFIRMNFNIEQFKEDLEQMGVERTKAKYRINRKKLHSICKMFEIETPKQGRPKTPITQEEVDYIINYNQKAHVGYHTMAGVAKRDPEAPKSLTTWRCHLIYEEHDLYQYLKLYRAYDDDHPNRYVARYVNQAWHTDLHYLEKLPEENNEQKYLIGFIDDRSRKIIHYQILDQKTSLLAMGALLVAFLLESPPKTMIMDNGTEFRGPFEDLLRNLNVELKKTLPYTPQQNGKIERWWETIERKKTQPLRGEYLDWIVQQYNTMWEHSSLRLLTNKGTTPQEAFQSMPRYAGQQDADFIYS